ncbi:MAG: methyltransferase domain-containing protein [Opitutae bacterium]|jgi:SAM-dependent methyltransferase|nr:methyltransferase domain-containing protein [Opitutae bacterium]
MTKDWDKAYQEGVTPWDKGCASPPLAQWLQKHRLSGEGLVLGCGLGHDVRLLASCCDQVTGMDISQTAINKARKMNRLNNVSYKVADFFNLEDFFTQSFDWIVEHTFFCAINPSMRQSYVENLIKVLKPNGYFLSVFFLKDGCNSNSEGPPYKINKEAVEGYFGSHFEVIESYIPQVHYDSRPHGSEYLCLMRLK